MTSSKNKTETNAILAIKEWLEEVIIDLNFCPFAKKRICK